MIQLNTRGHHRVARRGGFAPGVLRINACECRPPIPSSALWARFRPLTAGSSSVSGPPRRTVSACARRPRPRARRRRLRDPRGHGRRPAGRRLRLRDRRYRVPGSGEPLAAPRAARALAPGRHRRVRVGRRGLRAARPARHRALRATRRHVHGRGHLRRRDRIPREDCASSGVTAIELMPIAAFPAAATAGATTASISAPPTTRTVARSPSSGSSTPPTAKGSRCCSTSSTTTSTPPAPRGSRRSGPTSRASTETPWGRAINYDDRDSDAVREWVLQSAEQWIRDFHLDGLRLDAIHSIMDSNPEHMVAAVCRRVHAIKPGALVIAESGMNDPKVLTESGCDAVGPTTSPPRPAGAAHRRPRGLLRRVRHGRRDGQGVRPPALPRRHVLELPPPPLRGPADGVRSEQFVVFASNHDQVGNRALGDRLPVAARPLAAFCTLLAPFTPMLFQERNTATRRRSSSSPTTSTRRSRPPPARAGAASSPRSPSSPVRRSPIRRTRAPSSLRR